MDKIDAWKGNRESGQQTDLNGQLRFIVGLPSKRERLRQRQGKISRVQRLFMKIIS